MKNRQTRIFSNRQRRPDAAGISGDRLPAERGAQLGQVLHAGGAARDVADHEPDERDDLKRWQETDDIEQYLLGSNEGSARNLTLNCKAYLEGYPEE